MIDFRKNALLALLNADDARRLSPHVRAVSRPANSILYSPGQHVQTVYFPVGASLVSYVVGVDGVRAVETCMVGAEGAVGGIVSQGNLPAYTRIKVQAGGEFLTIPVAELEMAKRQSRSIDNMFARYADCLLARIFQATACNAVHSVEQRAAKWLVASIERTGSSTLPLTQQRLAAMLGVGRSYMSRIIKKFKAEAILHVRRGRLEVLDVEALRGKACSCDSVVKGHILSVLGGVYQDEDSAPVAVINSTAAPSK